jgi:hypothetical protein
MSVFRLIFSGFPSHIELKNSLFRSLNSDCFKFGSEEECLSLDLLNFVSIDDFPFYMRWENAGVTNLNHMMDTVTKNFLTFEKIKTLIKSAMIFCQPPFKLEKNLFIQLILR